MKKKSTSLTDLKILPLLISILFANLFFQENIFGQGTLGRWEVCGLTGTPTSVAATGVAANLTFSALTRGAGIAASTATDKFISTGWATGTTLSTTNNDYYEFTITPAAGFPMSIGSIRFRDQVSTGTTFGVYLRSSADNYAANLATWTASATVTNRVFPLTAVAALQGRTTAVTFRVYGAGATSNTTTTYGILCDNASNSFYGKYTGIDIEGTYKSQLVAMNLGTTTWCAGETRTIQIQIKNNGTAPWTDGNGKAFNIGVRWNTSGANWTDYHIRVSANLAAGATGTYNIPITAANNAGAGYTTNLAGGTNNLVFDVVMEGISWFGDNNPPLTGSGNTKFTSANQTISTPAINNMTASACTDAGFNVTPVNTTNGYVPSGTTYNWPAPVVTGGITGDAAGSGATSINGTLSNPTNTPQTATYTITPVSAGCTGSTFTLTVTVNPKSSITNITASTCSAVAFSVTPANGTNGSVVSGTTYTWAAPVVTGSITGGAASTGTPASITGTLTNPSNTNSNTGTYTVTPTSAGCAGNTFSVTVTVKPKPALTTTLTPAAICSGTLFTYSPISSLPSTTLTWTRAAIAGNAAISSPQSSDPNEVLTNNTNASANAIYAYTLVADGCSNNQNVTVPISPRPAINAMAGTACSATAFTVTPANNTNGIVPAGTTYTWLSPSLSAGLSGGAASSGSPSNINGTLTNSTNTAQSAAYTVTPTAGSCTGNPFTLTETINPKASVTAMATTTCSGTAFSATPLNGTNGSIPSGTTYTWTAPAVTGGLTGGAASSGSPASITGTLTNPTNTAQTATYTVTPSSAGCTGSSFTVTVTVNPKATVTAMVATACGSAGFTITPANGTNGIVPAGTTYSWPAPSVTGGLTGGASGSGASSVSGTLTNPTSAVQTATYTVTPLSGSCGGNNFTITVTVNPLPQTTGTAVCQNSNDGSISSSTTCLSGAPLSSGNKFPVSSVNFNSGGTAWTNPGNVNSDNNVYATSAVSSTSTGTVNASSQSIISTQFGFAIPANATIGGIVVTIGRFASQNVLGNSQDNAVQLVKAGAATGTNLGLTSTNWPTGEAAQAYGSASNLWGTTWTPAEINASNFGASLKVDNSATFFTTTTASVDYIQISVTYTVPGTLNWYTASSGGPAVGSGASFTVTSGYTGVPGTVTFYAECSTVPGCRTPTDVIVNPTPSIVLGLNPTVPRGTVSADLSFSLANENPDLYSVTWTGSPAGFGIVTNAPLPASVFALSINPAANVNIYNGNLIVTNSATGCKSGNNPFTVTITPVALTITGVSANNKPYDGTTLATLNGSPSYNGLVNSETFSVTGTPSANFDNSIVGTNKPVTITGYTAPNANYTLTAQPLASADIIPAVLTVTADNKTKNYDGNIYSGGYTSQLAGFVNSENASVVTGTVSYTGAAITATAAGSHIITPDITGLSAANYIFTPVNGTLTINPVSQPLADFRSKINGNISSAGTWEYNGGGGTWISATQKPGIGNNVEILHNVNFDEAFIVGPGKTLKVTSGTADFNNQSVTFASDATGTASFGEVTGTVSNADNVTVERYIPDNGFRSWRLLSVPVTTTQTIRQAWQEGDANPNAKDNNLPNRGTQITGVFNTQTAAAAAGFDSTSVNAAMLSWNGASWSNVVTTNQPITNNKSWFLYIRGERSQTVTGAVSNSSATTLRTKGTVYTGDQATSISANTFGLVPNLYPSAINFTGLSRTGGVSNLFYVWDSKKLNGNSLGVYQTFSGTNGFNCLVGGGSYVLGQPNTTIESGQSFFVTSGAAGTITLKESAKVSGTSGSLGFRPAAQSKLDTRLYNSAGEMLDANTVVFDAAYDKTVAGEDAPKMGNPGTNFAIERDNKLLAIEGTQPVKENDAIQFRIWNISAGTYSLGIEAQRLSLPENVSAILEDSYLKTKTAINLAATNKVAFTVNQDARSSSANRFKIMFVKAKPVATNSKPSYTIAPNPVENGTVNLQLNNQPAGRYAVRIVGEGGQSVAVKIISHAGGSAAQSISLPAAIGSGAYTLEIVAPDKTKSTQKVLVDRK